MDLATIKPATNRLDILHPGSGKPTGLVIDLLSDDTEAVRKIKRKQLDQAVRRGKKINSDDIEANVLELISARVGGWDWIGDASWGGKKLEFTPQNLAKVLAENWVRAQVEAALADEAAFFYELTEELRQAVRKAVAGGLPTVDLEVDHIWEWFWDIGRGRQAGFDGPQAISAGEAVSWCQLTGNTLRLAEWQMIRAMDDAFLAEVRKRNEARQAKEGKKKGATFSAAQREAARPATASDLDRMFR